MLLCGLPSPEAIHNQGAGERADPATREALRDSSALLEGFRALKQFPLNTRTAEQICTRIKGTEMQVRRVPGTTLANQALHPACRRGCAAIKAGDQSRQTGSAIFMRRAMSIP